MLDKEAKLTSLAPASMLAPSFICTFLLVAYFPEYYRADDERYMACNQPYNCGSFSLVGYPFWGNDRQAFCGLRDFKLECSDPQSSSFSINIGSKVFPVLYLSLDRLTLLPADLGDNICFNRGYSLPLNSTDKMFGPFSYDEAGGRLRMFYNCRQNNGTLPQGLLQGNLSCPNGVKTYVVYSFGNPMHFDGCTNSTTVHVRSSAYYLLWNNTITLEDALSQGFDVNYEAHQVDCAACEASGGRCGSGDHDRFICLCPDEPFPKACPAHGGGRGSGFRLKIIIGNMHFQVPFFLPFVLAALVRAGLIVLVIFLIYFMRHTQSFMSILRMKTKEDKNLEAFIRDCGSLAPKRYSYADIKKMTNSLKNEIGQGGFGTVYKGKLSDGRLVAVKMLNVAKENGEEFVNEVLSISKTSHVNVVMFLGFCIEGKRRALVYDYMPNGSLDKYIHGQKHLESHNQLRMDKLYQISLGVARGLEYLHQRCNTRILHFDIKPHNILLDENFCPKISDFGLAKQCVKNESFVSILGARGTIGYIAPELVSRSFGGISYKSDVYSYGMMILEIVGRRKNVSKETSHTSEVYFPQWAYQHLVVKKDLRLKGVVTLEEDEIARKIILVGLWCIQSDPSQRPTMSKVIEMLEGRLQAIEIPPKAFLGSPSSTPQVPSASRMLEGNSQAVEIPSKAFSGSPSTTLQAASTSIVEMS